MNTNKAPSRFQFSLSGLLTMALIVPLLIGLGIYSSSVNRLRAELSKTRDLLEQAQFERDNFQNASAIAARNIQSLERSNEKWELRCNSHCLPPIPEIASVSGSPYPFVAPVSSNLKVFSCSGAFGVHDAAMNGQFAQWVIGAARNSRAARVALPGKKYIDGRGEVWLASASEVISAEICPLLPRVEPERGPEERHYVLWLSLGSDQSRYTVALDPLNGTEFYEIESKVQSEVKTQPDEKRVLFRVLKRPVAKAESAVEVFALTLDYSKQN